MAVINTEEWLSEQAVGKVLQIFAEVHDLQRVWLHIGVHSVSYSMAKGVGYFPGRKTAGALG